MACFEEYYFDSSNGKNRIRVLKCVPHGDVRGVVQIAHGIAEHIDRYRPFMQYLAAAGFVCVGNDHLGHGKSISSKAEEGIFNVRQGWKCVVHDLVKVHDLTATEYPGKPYIVFGHSMGSFLMRTYLIDYPGKCDAAIISGTGHQDKALIAAGNLIAQLTIRKHGYISDGQSLADLSMGSYQKKIRNPRTNSDWLSRDTSQVDRYEADPLCGFVAKAGLYADMLQGVRYVTTQKNIERMAKDTPVFFMSGDMDPVGDYGKGVKRAVSCFRKAGMKYVTCKLYEGGRHEMLNEINKDEVYADVLSWLNEVV